MLNIEPVLFEPRRGERLVYLTRGFTALIDAADWPLVEPYMWHTHFARSKVYARTRGENGQPIYLHRLIMQAPDGKLVDHQNHNSLDCRRFNLVVKGFSANAQNCNYSTTRAYRGVYERPNGRFSASIKINGKQLSLGTHDTAKLAAEAYDAAALRHHGPGAWTNSKHAAGSFNAALADQAARMTELIEDIPF